MKALSEMGGPPGVAQMLATGRPYRKLQVYTGPRLRSTALPIRLGYSVTLTPISPRTPMEIPYSRKET